MKNLLKVSCLVVALLATVAMIGCGGGGGGGGNPAAPVNTTSNEARAAQETVSPVLQNADTILGIDVNASSRASTSDTQEFSVTSTNNAIISAFEAPNLIRAVISATGGNIDGGLWENERSGGYKEIATYSNGVYERTVYESDDIISYYKIDGCVADYNEKDKIIRSLSINKGAKITVDEKRGIRFHTGYHRYNPTSFKGTINTDLIAQWEGKVETFNSPKVFELTWDYTIGKDITNDFKNYEMGLQTSKRITSKTTYSFSRLELDLTEFQMFDIPVYYYDQEFKGNIKINIDGISGDIVLNKTSYYSQIINSSKDSWNWYNGNSSTSYTFVSSKKPVINFKYANPVSIALSGNVSNYIFGINGWHKDEEPIDYEDKKEKYSGTINNLNIKLRNVSGNFDSIVVGDAEAYIDISDYKQDQAIKIGNQEVVFNKAKVDITGLKYNYAWKKDESLTENEFNRKCFGKAKATFEAEETKNKVTIKGDCDIEAKTVNVNMVNNGNYIVKDNTSPKKVLEFNFKTVDIKGTNADVLADNKCEGTVLKVTGIEKDGTKSERTYNVKNGKLVLDTKSQKDKQAPASLPNVKIENIPNELSNSNSIEVAVSEAKPSEEIMKDPANESLKIGKKGDLKVASYNKKKTNNSKKIETNVSAKNKLIAAVSFYGDNDYTLVFVIDYSDEKHPQIKGSIFKGKVNNKTMDSPDRIAQFAGKDGKITVVTSVGSSEVAVQ